MQRRWALIFTRTLAPYLARVMQLRLSRSRLLRMRHENMQSAVRLSSQLCLHREGHPAFQKDTASAASRGLFNAFLLQGSSHTRSTSAECVQLAELKSTADPVTAAKATHGLFLHTWCCSACSLSCQASSHCRTIVVRHSDDVCAPPRRDLLRRCEPHRTRALHIHPATKRRDGAVPNAGRVHPAATDNIWRH